MFNFFNNESLRSFKFFCSSILIFWSLWISDVIEFNIKFEVILTVMSIILLTNITALFAIDKKVLVMLYENKNESKTSSLYKLLMKKYKHVIYLSFIYIIVVFIVESVDVNLMYFMSKDLSVFFTGLVKVFNLSLFVYIMCYNVCLIDYYFLSLKNAIKQDIMSKKKDV